MNLGLYPIAILYVPTGIFRTQTVVSSCNSVTQKSKVMKGEIKGLYIKRTQRDYPLSFKIAVVREVESGAITNNGVMRKYGIQGHGTIAEWRRKYGIFDEGNTVRSKYSRPTKCTANARRKLKRTEE